MTSPSDQIPAGLEPGLEAHIEKEVPAEWTIAHYDPRLPAVLSTPALIGMMEVAAAQSVEASLPSGRITVGTRIEVNHLKAVSVGARVVVSARLAEINGRFLVFDVEARSGEHVIGRGRVFRAVVERQSFSVNASARAQS